MTTRKSYIWIVVSIVTILLISVILLNYYNSRILFDFENNPETSKEHLFSEMVEISCHFASILAYDEEQNPDGGIRIIRGTISDLALDIFNFENEFRKQASLDERNIYMIDKDYNNTIIMDTQRQYFLLKDTKDTMNNLDIYPKGSFGEYFEEWYLFLRYELYNSNPLMNGAKGEYVINDDKFIRNFQQIYGSLPDVNDDGIIDAIDNIPPQLVWIKNE